MKQIIFSTLISGLLTGCATAPMPKQPDESNRVPVNKTVPDEIKNGQVPGMRERRVS